MSDKFFDTLTAIEVAIRKRALHLNTTIEYPGAVCVDDLYSGGRWWFGTANPPHWGGNLDVLTKDANGDTVTRTVDAADLPVSVDADADSVAQAIVAFMATRPIYRAHWANEHGSAFYVPPALLAEKDVEDISWHNDVACSFVIKGYRRNDDGLPNARLWVDHIDRDMREFDGNDRLIVYRLVGTTDAEALYRSDDINDWPKALDVLRKATTMADYICAECGDGFDGDGEDWGDDGEFCSRECRDRDAQAMASRGETKTTADVLAPRQVRDLLARSLSVIETSDGADEHAELLRELRQALKGGL